MKCPKCYYQLTLREYSRKYKCPACKKLFPQKELELKEFVEYNKLERQKDKEALAETKSKKTRLTEFEKKQNARASYERWKEKHPDYNSKKCKEYYQKNKDKVLAQQKEYRFKSGQEIKNRLKLKKIKNIGESRLMERIKYWRTRQKELALKYLENGTFKPFTFEFEDTLPTFWYR